MARVTIVDSGICNLGSIGRALERAGGAVTVAARVSDVALAERLVLPGVGSFPAGMNSLHERGLVEAIRDFAASGKPLLGICLGMQLLFESGSEFGETPGLGLIPGRVREINAPGLAVPHMGWNRLEPARQDPLLAGLPGEAFFYFVHSYVCEPADPADVLAVSEYGERFCAAVQRGNVRGLQAHPEKSQHCGATVLANFLRLK
ncbi:MAG: imidazole glycerol phosphate synthase subunit HisH [Planctomycetes bacterium]|nr:imidazole glycerol phosphate synthase subunit HisH [Planctomycetota bacterium]MCW8134798.1 imidazole glycerol phosphate synthase subunit HisH [Planctomycetota bacterium]